MSLLQDAFVYLVAAVIAVPIAKRLGLGSVLGYLIAGIVIGPLLGVVGSETEKVKHFAEFGVVMMLFLVGLELQPAMLWKMRAKLLGLGGLQVLLSTALIGGLGVAFSLPWQTALAIGMTLALSSTAIVLQTLNEKGQMKTVGGQSSFSVLLFQDIAVIPMLAILPLLAVSHALGGDGSHTAQTGHNVLSALPGWLQALVILVVIAAIIGTGRYLIRPVFRFIAEAKLREIFTAAALLLVIGIALLMEAVGLSPALGTFLAGVVLSDSEYRHELESDIDPFKGLLLGLFFISVGAGVDFELLFGAPGTIFGLAFGILSLKFIVLYILAVGFRLPTADRWLFSLGLAQAGEFAFVLFGFALSAGAIPPDLAKMLTLVVAITMLITPALFIVHDRVIAPRLVEKNERKADIIDETGPVVVAGVGRYGQVVARLLMSSGYKVIVLDHDPQEIEALGRVGIKTFYGDASRPDLLHAAGLEEAKLFVAAIDNRDQQTLMVEHVAKTYPHLKIVARAFDRHHVYELEIAGAHVAERELFESSITMGRKALVLLGLHPFLAERKSRAFRSHDLETLDQLRDRWITEGVDQHYLDTIKSRGEQLLDVMKLDNNDVARQADDGWLPPPKGDANS
ncbi:monovalent cation:proton antiporter-2 (CPA2) family protein [Pseudovibrio sp. SPO723]|uniref:monovalent cation:proton antiporter-2 (CPA2) family protein n=1 Tax=Nesiotobacter zosterae TaxID=392721 RepID=UPI0029C1772A|nr:monovalent cation:proton antiporter-2 (CPA2) family protein [Pseudovibrio sp. SPO723]MDX5594365.1 monovalent cation:proton antiporter-2 (CPA2) family protein [Pseudovibrio sp. SPO723]